MPTLSVRCPRCQTVLKLNAALAGQATKCTQCGQGMIVPGAAAPPVVQAPPQVTPSAAQSVAAVKPAPAAAPAPRRELTKQEIAARQLRANLLMLFVGLVVLAGTLLLLLQWTDPPPAAP